MSEKSEIHKGEATWTDRAGATHWAVGTRMVPDDPGTFIMWACCGKSDIPANAAVYGKGGVDCPECLAHAGDGVTAAKPVLPVPLVVTVPVPPEIEKDVAIKAREFGLDPEPFLLVAMIRGTLEALNQDATLKRRMEFRRMHAELQGIRRGK